MIRMRLYQEGRVGDSTSVVRECEVEIDISLEGVDLRDFASLLVSCVEGENTDLLTTAEDKTKPATEE